MKAGIWTAVASLAILVAGPLPAGAAGAATPRYTTISQLPAADPGFSKFGPAN